METPVKSAQGDCYQGGGTSLEMGPPHPPLGKWSSQLLRVRLVGLSCSACFLKVENSEVGQSLKHGARLPGSTCCLLHCQSKLLELPVLISGQFSHGGDDSTVSPQGCRDEVMCALEACLW